MKYKLDPAERKLHLILSQQKPQAQVERKRMGDAALTTQATTVDTA